MKRLISVVPEIRLGDREQENEQPEGVIGGFHMWKTGSDQGDTVMSVLIPSLFIPVKCFLSFKA